ncbi:MAG: hypothetical protein AAF639_17200 [Chloroflexota bacterium]
MTVQILKPETLEQTQDEIHSESVLTRIDALIAEMTQLRLHTMIGEMTQLRQLIQGLLPTKPMNTVPMASTVNADEQDWVEELYGSLAPPQPRSRDDELDFFNSIDVGLQRFDGVFEDEFGHYEV